MSEQSRDFFKNPWLNTRYFFKDPDAFMNGWYSNFPLCCVRFWIDNHMDKDLAPFGITMQHMRTGTDDTHKYIEMYYDDDTERYIEEDAHYVQCDHCWDTGKVNECRSGYIVLEPWYLWGMVLKRIGLIRVTDDEVLFLHREWLRKLGFNINKSPWG